MLVARWYGVMFTCCKTDAEIRERNVVQRLCVGLSLYRMDTRKEEIMSRTRTTS